MWWIIFSIAMIIFLAVCLSKLIDCLWEAVSDSRVFVNMFCKRLYFGYKSCKKLNNGYFLVFKDGKIGVIKKWKIIIPIEYVEIKQKNDYFE